MGGPSMAIYSQIACVCAVSADAMGGQGSVVSLAVHSHMDQHRVLVVHSDSGATVWDLRQVIGNLTLGPQSDAYHGHFLDIRPVCADLASVHDSPTWPFLHINLLTQAKSELLGWHRPLVCSHTMCSVYGQVTGVP